MLTALKLNFPEPVLAWGVSKVDGPFACPECRSAVIAKKGDRVVHHFAHAPGSRCPAATRSSIAHDTAKFAIYQALRAAGLSAKVERPIGDRRCDVVYRSKGKLFVVEVQRSDLARREILARTRTYAENQCAVIWVVPETAPAHGAVKTPAAWRVDLQELGPGAAFHYLGGTALLPVRFETHQLWVEPRTWYSGGGNEESGGGYYRDALRKKDVLHGPNLVCLTEFVHDDRPGRGFARLPATFTPSASWRPCLPIGDCSTWKRRSIRGCESLLDFENIYARRRAGRLWCGPLRYHARELGHGYTRHHLMFEVERGDAPPEFEVPLGFEVHVLSRRGPDTPQGHRAGVVLTDEAFVAALARLNCKTS